jgi:hypothetical protein
MQRNAKQCNAMQCNAMQCNAMQCNTVDAMRLCRLAFMELRANQNQVINAQMIDCLAD